MTFIHSISSAVVEIWVLLNFTPCTYSQELLLWLIHFELLQKTCQGMYFVKVLWGVSIYLYRFWCLTCKQPLPRFSSLTPLHTRQELVFLTDPFWTLFKISSSCVKVLSSVMIYLYRSWCLICKQLLPRSSSLTPLHTRQELLLWLIHFELLQNLIKVCALWKSMRRLDLSLQIFCLICKQLLPRSLSFTSFHTL